MYMGILVFALAGFPAVFLISGPWIVRALAGLGSIHVVMVLWLATAAREQAVGGWGLLALSALAIWFDFIAAGLLRRTGIHQPPPDDPPPS